MAMPSRAAGTHEAINKSAALKRSEQHLIRPYTSGPDDAHVLHHRKETDDRARSTWN